MFFERTERITRPGHTWPIFVVIRRDTLTNYEIVSHAHANGNEDEYEEEDEGQSEDETYRANVRGGHREANAEDGTGWRARARGRERRVLMVA